MNTKRKGLIHELARHAVKKLPTPIPQMLRAGIDLGYLPNYWRPRSFNEKIGWQLLNRRDQRWVRLADKLAVKDYVRALCPSVRIPQTFTVATDAAGLDFKSVPDVAVVKATHGSGLVHVVEKHQAGQHLREYDKWLELKPWDIDWEWHYNGIVPRLYVEEFIGHDIDSSVPDYKLIVVNGKVLFTQVFVNRNKGALRLMYDRDWSRLPIFRSRREAQLLSRLEDIPRPNRLNEMYTIAERLGKSFPVVRVDLYYVDEEIWFGELTFSPSAGRSPFYPKEYDFLIGRQISLK